MISWWKAIILGIVQGLGEFLPISSSGHIQLTGNLLGIEPDIMLTILLHLGTLVAVLIVYWRDWWDIIRGFWKSKTLLMLIIASVPAVILKAILSKINIGGTPLDDLLDSGVFLGCFFVITSIMLMLADWIGMKRAEKLTENVGVKQALAMGCLQAVGQFSGISRSGSSIFGGMATGLTRGAAAKFSFMMSVPAILGGLLIEVYHGLKEENGAEMLKQNLTGNAVPYLLGMLAAGIVGYLAIRFFLRLISKHSFKGFALYTPALGIVRIVLQATGVLVF